MIWILTGIAAGFLAGAASRQPEINRLKSEVKRLQHQVNELQGMVEKQNQTIARLKYEYKALRATHFFEKRKVKQRAKGAIIFQYAYKEFIELSLRLAQNKQLSVEETTYYNLFDALIHGQDIPMAEKGAIKVYVEARYKYEVENLIELNPEEIVSQLEAADVA